MAQREGNECGAPRADLFSIKRHSNKFTQTLKSAPFCGVKECEHTQMFDSVDWTYAKGVNLELCVRQWL